MIHKFPPDAQLCDPTRYPSRRPCQAPLEVPCSNFERLSLRYGLTRSGITAVACWLSLNQFNKSQPILTNNSSTIKAPLTRIPHARNSFSCFWSFSALPFNLTACPEAEPKRWATQQPYIPSSACQNAPAGQWRVCRALSSPR